MWVPIPETSCVLLLLVLEADRTLEGDSPAPAPHSEEDKATREKASRSRERRKNEAKPPLLFLRDSSRIAGRPELDELTVDTSYGTLHVPLHELIQVRFAYRLSGEDRLRVEEAIKGLGADDFDEREKAMNILLEIGYKAQRLLLEAARSPDEEVKNRSQILLQKIAESGRKEKPSRLDGFVRAPEGEEIEPLEGDEEDEVVLERFKVKGRVLEEVFPIQTGYGSLKVRRDDIVGITFDRENQLSRSFDVPASNNVPENWVNTKLTFSRGQKITVKATGQVFVPNYSLSSGPEGTTRYSGGGFLNFPTLSLVGRIGKYGKPFFIGREYKGKALKERSLYLGIVPFRRSYVATGSFQVKVEGN